VVLAHVVVLSAALLTLLCLPCVFAAFVCADELPRPRLRIRRPRLRRRSDRAARELRRREQQSREEETRALRQLDHALRNVKDPVPLAVAAGPSIEEIAFDLRRLDRQRRCGPTLESERWRAAVLRAYDARLCLACRRLGLTEHLEQLDGMDRDLERLRVESELEAAGLVLHA
jgi:hypothetical protein